MRQDDNNEPQFRDIFDKFAIVQTEHTEDVSSYTRKFEKWSEPLTGPLKLATDDSDCKTEVMLVSAAEDVYRLLLRIRSDTMLRVIDPIDTMIRLARSAPVVECQHKKDYRRAMQIQDHVKAYSFDDLLGHWQEIETFYGMNKMNPAGLVHNTLAEGDERGLTYHVSHFLASPAQLNVALALTVNDMVVLNLGQCCLECSIEKARTMPLTYSLGQGQAVLDRYIINVASNIEKKSVIGVKRKLVI